MVSRSVHVDSSMDRNSFLHPTLGAPSRPILSKSAMDPALIPSPFSLLRDLDSRTSLGDLSLCKNAAQDALFLRHDFRQISNTKRLLPLRRVLDLTTALLKRMKCLRRSLLIDGEQSYLSFGLTFDDIISDRFYANLEHLLRCLQQIALDAILLLTLSLSLAYLFRWSHHQQMADAWFAEWPNALHPLNTTWPWNVKTALLVLWGVCWMFYAHGGACAPFDNRDTYGQDVSFRMRQNPPQGAPTPAPTLPSQQRKILSPIY